MAAGGDQQTAVPGPGPGTPGPASPGPASPTPATTAPPAGRRPWWVWAVPFAALFIMLCVRNRFLFTTRLYEQGDGGANAILIAQAKHFTLLIGNYSREGFNHPGPAYLYVQAFGEYLFQNLLHLVPTAWNAHMLSVFALDSAFVALAVGVVYGWTRSVRGAAACFAVFVAFAVAYPPIVNSDWMPYMYVPTYVVFLLAAASVAAGRGQDAWVLALSGWFLVHGQACFLLFVPVITVAVLVAVAWPARRTPRASAAAFFRERRVWLPVVVISAVFALPIVINLVLHWPGDFGRYITYGKSSSAGGHGVRQVLRYALHFWWPHPLAWLVLVLACAAALGLVWRLGPGTLRRFCLALLAIDLVSSLAFVFYAAVGIDDLKAYYIGYFYWSAPLVVALVVVLVAAETIGARAGTVLAAVAALAAFVALTVVPGTSTSTNDIDQALPHVVATLAARAPGKMIVLRIDHSAWVETTGVLIQAERTGVRACVDQPRYTVLFSRQFICTPAQAAGGADFWFYTAGSQPPGAHVLLQFSGVTVAPAP